VHTLKCYSCAALHRLPVLRRGILHLWRFANNDNRRNRAHILRKTHFFQPQYSIIMVHSKQSMARAKFSSQYSGWSNAFTGYVAFYIVKLYSRASVKL